MDKLELLVSRHKKIIRKEKYKKADKKLDIIFVQACYYVVNEYLGLKDQFRNVSEVFLISARVIWKPSKRKIDGLLKSSEVIFFMNPFMLWK